MTILSLTFIFYMQDGTKHRLLYQFSNIAQLSNNVPNRGWGGGGAQGDQLWIKDSFLSPNVR